MSADATLYQYLASTRDALNGNDLRAAYHVATTGLIAHPSVSELYLAAAECAHRGQLTGLAHLFEGVGGNPASPEAVMALAQELLASGDAPLAVAVAGHALSLRTDSLPAATLLALSLAADFQPERGCVVLGSRALADFNSRYAMAWCSLLCGHIDDIPDFIDRTRSDLRRSPLAAADQAHYELWLEYLEECLARLVTVEHPPRHVRPWHFIQYGSVLLDCCEYTDAAGGRFVATWLTYHEILTRMQKLVTLLREVDRAPSLVLATPDRDSQIVGRVAAELFKVGFSTARPDNVCQARTLVAAAHGRDLHPLPVEITDRGQTVFALDFGWLHPGPVVPDVCGALSLSCAMPWHGPAIRPGDAAAPAATVETFPGERDVVRRILDAHERIEPGAGSVIAFYRERSPDLKGSRTGQRRMRFRRDSPVSTMTSWRVLL